MERIKYLALLLFSVTTFAQQPILVKALSPEDTAKAQSFQQRQVALDAEKKTFEQEIVRKYLTTHDEKLGQYPFGSLGITVVGPVCMHVTSNGLTESDNCPETLKEKAAEKEQRAKQLWTLRGWADGTFEYSEDYKFIVPKRYVPANPSFGIGCENFVAHPVNTTDR